MSDGSIVDLLHQEEAESTDTSMVQRVLDAGRSLDGVQDAALNAFDKFVGVGTKLNSQSASEQETGSLAAGREGLLHATNALGSSSSSGLMWLLLIAVGVLVLSCMFCLVRRFEQRSTNPPPYASKTDSVSSFGSSSQVLFPPKPKPTGSAASLPSSQCVSARSGAISRRGSRAGRALSDRVMGKTKTGKVSSRTPSARNSIEGRKCGMSTPTSGPSASFAVPVDNLVDVAEGGSFNIVDLLSGLAMKVTLSRNAQGSRKIELFTGEAGQTLCASVQPVPGSQTNPAGLEFCGPDGLHLGSLTLQMDGSFLVRAQAMPQLIIEGDEADMDLRVSGCDGSKAASVSCKQDHPGGPEHVEIHVMPNTDPVLVVASVLAILFLCGEGLEEDSNHVVASNSQTPRAPHQ